MTHFMEEKTEEVRWLARLGQRVGRDEASSSFFVADNQHSVTSPGGAGAVAAGWCRASSGDRLPTSRSLASRAHSADLRTSVCTRGDPGSGQQ